MVKKLLALLCVAGLFTGAMDLHGQTVAIVGGEIHTMSGEVIPEGILLIREGRIAAVGRDIQVPSDARLVQAKGFVLYPGFISLSTLPSSGEIKNFESISPDLTSIDRFECAGNFIPFVSGGITSLYLTTGSDRLISGNGTVIKLSGWGMKALVLKPAAALNINLGKDSLLPPYIGIFPAPVSTENPIVPARKQYPSAALGAYWTLLALFRFEPYSGDLAKYMENISSHLQEAKNKKLPLLIRCRKAADIQQAVEIARILDMSLIIRGADEAYKLAKALRDSKVSIWAEAFIEPGGPQQEVLAAGEGIFCPENIPSLIKEGIPVAICPAEEAHLSDLIWICQYYQRFGIPEEDLFRTITINPARMLGLDDRVGSLEEGKDADILFFRKEPGKPLPRLEKVMIQGKVVYEKE